MQREQTCIKRRGTEACPLPVAEEGKASVPQWSKNASKAKVRSIFREPQGGSEACPLPAAEKGQASVPQRSKNASKAKARSIFRHPARRIKSHLLRQ